ncbi:MAG: YqhA family protein [Bacteroidetes bacterium]|jgi:uncharacterized membrane protein YqhA|nr:YqhA family protein [Bacteroidota bacterium]
MNLERKVLFRKLLGNSKWIALLGVIVLYISSALLILIGIAKLYWIVMRIIDEVQEGGAVDTILLSANFFVIIEIYLLSIVFYIFAVGIYKLFVEEVALLKWLKMDSIDDLKSHIAKSVVLFLSVFMVQKITEWEEPEKLFYYASTVAMTSAILLWYIMIVKNGNGKNHNDKVRN